MTDQMFGLQDCGSCRYAVSQPLVKGPLQCRRRPPTPVPIQQGNGIGTMNLWPLVTKGDSCGEGLPKMIPIIGDVSIPHLAGNGAG